MGNLTFAFSPQPLAIGDWQLPPTANGYQLTAITILAGKNQLTIVDYKKNKNIQSFNFA